MLRSNAAILTSLVDQIRTEEKARAAALNDNDLSRAQSAGSMASRLTAEYAERKGWGSGSSRVAHPTQPGVPLFVPQTPEGKAALRMHDEWASTTIQQAMSRSDDSPAWRREFDAIVERINGKADEIRKGIDSMETLKQQAVTQVLMANFNRAC